MIFFETSAKNDINVRKSFTKLIVGIYHTILENQAKEKGEAANKPQENTINLKNGANNASGSSGKKGCC